MTRVELTLSAVEDLDRLVRVLSLPPDAKARVRASLEPLSRFPLLGAELRGRWHGLRFILGLWRWMLLVYEYLEPEDRVVIVTIQDARSSTSATGE